MCGDQFTKPTESRYGSFVSSPNSVPKIQSSGLNPRKTANSAHFVSPISACNSYGFAIFSLCAWKLSERSSAEENTSELQSRRDLVCRLLLEKKKTNTTIAMNFPLSFAT